jgi:hypothetical protein
MTTTSRATSGALAFAVWLGCALALGAPRAEAQPIKPWTPAAADSLVAWAAEARVRFHSNTGDSIGGANVDAYNLVGQMGRRLLRSLGAANMIQAPAIEAVLDSLGLDTSVAIDVAQPTFAILVVRNPYRVSAQAVGYFYWYRGQDLRIQGLGLRGGREPHMRVWWTARSAAPYECAIVYHTGWGDSLALNLMALSSDGYYWRPVQFEHNGPDLSGAYQATLVDVDGDVRPELLAWSRAAPDSLFEECAGCPKPISEELYVEGPQGYELHDSHLIPSAYATFMLFIRLLRDRNRAAAARVLANPAMVDSALALGWASGHGKGLWRLEYTESDRQWPTWLAMRFHGPKGSVPYIVHFTQKAGRWVIGDWVVPRAAGRAPEKARAPRAPGSR